MASVLSIPELLDLAAGAGFSGPDLTTAVAIALAESGGNPQAINTKEPHGSSYGIWQIYLYAHPQFSAGSLLDPSYNAAAAYQVYQGAGYSFTPWSTFTSGKYLAYLFQVDAAGAPSSPAGGDGTTAAGMTAAGIVTTLPPFDFGTYWPVLAAGAGILWLLSMRG